MLSYQDKWHACYHLDLTCIVRIQVAAAVHAKIENKTIWVSFLLHIMLIISKAKALGEQRAIYRTFIDSTPTQHSHNPTVQHFSDHL